MTTFAGMVRAEYAAAVEAAGVSADTAWSAYVVDPSLTNHARLNARAAVYGALQDALATYDRDTADICAYCHVRASAVTPADILVCYGHADMRTDRPL